jgi:hypothetical protein
MVLGEHDVDVVLKHHVANVLQMVGYERGMVQMTKDCELRQLPLLFLDFVHWQVQYQRVEVLKILVTIFSVHFSSTEPVAAPAAVLVLPEVVSY